MKRTFEIPDYKPSYAKWYVKLDVSAWLGDETISSVTVTAKNKTTGVDESTGTTSIIDTSKTTISGSVVKPFIQNGTSGEQYKMTVKLLTTEGSADEFYVEWKVLDDQ